MTRDRASADVVLPTREASRLLISPRPVFRREIMPTLLRLACLALLLGTACTPFADTTLTEDPFDRDALDDGHDHGAHDDAASDRSDIEISCPSHCALLDQICGGPNFPYEDGEDCLLTCQAFAGWELGSFEDILGNSVGCRIWHTDAAEREGRDRHCPHAGPSGGGLCGTWCTNYCYLEDRVCRGNGVPLYESTTACEAACASFRDDRVGAIGSTTGDSVQCRIEALLRASRGVPQSAVQHCPAAAVDGGGVCVD
jgi:hypothetical protein